MRTIENWDHVPLHIIEKYRECDFSGINFVFAESNFSNLMQMWGKCVKQTAGILRWMDRVHLLGHSEVGRVGKNTNPKKMREDTNICGGWSIQRAKRRRRKGKAELDFAKAFFPLFEGACYRGGRRKCLRPCSTAFAFTWNARRWRRSTLHIVHYSLHIEHCTMHIALERPLSGLRLACWPDFETWCTSLELYNLSTRSTLLQPFCTEGCSGAQDAPCSPESWDEWVWIRPGLCVYVWSGLIKMDCCTKFVIQTAL